MSSYEYQCNVQPIQVALSKGPKESSCMGIRYFRSLESFKKHYQEKHEKGFELPFKCSDCQNAFILEEALLCHQRFEHGKEIRIEKCKYCPREFFSTATKVTHENMHTECTRNELYYCKLCLNGLKTVLKIMIFSFYLVN